MRRDVERAARAGADAVELRLDFLARPPDAEELRALLAAPRPEAIVTFRPVRQGGLYDGDESARLRVLQFAADAGAEWIDVEGDVPTASRPHGAKLILSHHDFEKCPADLDDIVARLAAAGPAVVKVAFAAAGPEDAFRALDVVRNLSPRRSTLALAMGEAGIASRVLAAKLGAFGTFAALAHGAESAPGQPTLDEMKRLYRWDSLGPATGVFGVVGCPVGHSMSPAIHNAAFAAAGVDGVYLPLLVAPGREAFGRLMDGILSRAWLGWRGLSVTIPHKENALAYVGAARCDELARRIGAVNTITIGPGGELRGDNTDYAAAIDALCAALKNRDAPYFSAAETGPLADSLPSGGGKTGCVPIFQGIRGDTPRLRAAVLKGRSVAVLGAGGAARAIVAALVHYGAEVTIYNRTVSRAEKLAAEFACRAAPADEATLARIAQEIVINGTSVGMHPDFGSCPLPAIPPAVRVVFDTIYNPVETLLLKRARQAGCVCVTGLEMFINQAAAQFELWTGRPAPRDVMRRVVVERLGSG